MIKKLNNLNTKLDDYNTKVDNQIDRELSSNTKTVSDLAPTLYGGIGTLADFLNGGYNSDPNVSSNATNDNKFYASNVINKVGKASSMLLKGISKIPLDKIKEESKNFGNAANFISGGLRVIGDITDMAQGKDKTALDYVKTGADIATTIAGLPFIKEIPGVGGVAGLASDAIRIAELAKNKSKNPLYWSEVGVDALSNVVSEVPVFGTALAPIGYGLAFFLHTFGNVIEDANKSWEGQQWDIERKLIDQKNDRLKFEADQRTRIENARIAKEKENEKKITTLEDSHLPRMLNQVDYDTEDDYKKALYNYVDLVHQGKMKDINVNDINWMKGQIVTDSYGYQQSFHDFIVNNDFNKAFEELKHSNVQIDPNYNKIRNHTSVFDVRDKNLAEQQKFIYGVQGSLSDKEIQKRIDNTTPPWDNSNEAIQYYNNPIIHPEWVPTLHDLEYLAHV